MSTKSWLTVEEISDRFKDSLLEAYKYALNTLKTFQKSSNNAKMKKNLVQLFFLNHFFATFRFNDTYIKIFLDTISKVALVQLRSKTCIWFFFCDWKKKTGNDYKYMNLIMLVSLCVILFLQILTKRSRYKTEIDICCQQFEPFKNNSFNIQPSIRPDFFW